MKQVLMLIVALFASFVCLWMHSLMQEEVIHADTLAKLQDSASLIPQNKTAYTEELQTYDVLYWKDQRLGALKEKEKLNQKLEQVYEQRYAKEYPHTKLGLGEDIYIRQEVVQYTYEDKDDEILQFIDEHDLFSVEANKIEFSNGEVMYVKNVEDFEQAQEQFALNFIDKETYDILKSGKETPELGNQEYGSRVLSAGFKEDINIVKGLAPVNRIANNAEEALKILSYGYDGETKTYVTKEYDTVQGIAWLQNISVSHLLSMNKDILVSEKQLLPVGTKLNVTPIDSPIHFEVVMENQVEEVVYPSETLIVYDDTLREGIEEIDTKQELGTENARYQETFVNGKSTGQGEKISSVITKQPIREVKRVGTKIYPHIGSGHFRWPVEVVSITCGWLCYSGHQANDVQNRYDFYGKVLASDRGTVIENSYHYINGYYMIIDHNNGYTSYYGHMANPGFFPVGTVVQQGEAIGNIGMTGLATGPHIHFEIRKNGVRLDPSTVVGK